jgi:hypothetical protein
VCPSAYQKHVQKPFWSCQVNGTINWKTCTICVLNLYPSLSMFWALDGHIFHVGNNGLEKCYLMALAFYN